MSHERFKAVDFAGLTGLTLSTLLVKYPEPQISAYAILKPFDLPVTCSYIYINLHLQLTFLHQ
jgi:hypothetical protein